MPLTPKQMESLLKKNGFLFISSNGSHHKYFNPRSNKTVIVPFHARDLKRGIEQAILKQAGLK